MGSLDGAPGVAYDGATLMTQTSLKAALRAAQNNTEDPRIGSAALIGPMLRHIGALDSELRDDLIYGTFNRWIAEDRIGDDALRSMLGALIGVDYLFHRIDSPAYACVFKRSFSTLLIALIVDRHNRRPLLNADSLRRVEAALLDYYAAERIVAGYYPKEGWAHSVAHAADAFVVLLEAGLCSPSSIRRLLDLIGRKFSDNRCSFVNGEDDRTAPIVATILTKYPMLREEVLVFIRSAGAYDGSAMVPNDHILRGNLRNLFRSIYFAAGDAGVKAAAAARQQTLAFR